MDRWGAPPVLAEGDVGLRPLAPRDADDVAELLDDPAVARWCPPLAGAPWPSGGPGGPGGPVGGAAGDHLAAAARGWRDGSLLELALVHRGRCAGLVALAPDGAGAAEAAVALAPWARGRGVASAGLRVLLVWAFAELGLQVVHWRAEVGAWPARRLAHALGSPVEGAVRDLLVVGGDRREAWVGSLRWDDPLWPARPWLHPVALAGAGLVLGPHRPGDVERVAQACSAPSTQAWLPSLPSPYTLLDAAAHVASREEEGARGTGCSWAVRAAAGEDGGEDSGDAGGDLLAEVAVRLAPGGRDGELGYWCHPDARRRGVVSGAVDLVAAHALAPAAGGGLGLERVVLRIAATNAASLRVAARCGFTPSGAERGGERLRDGTRVDFLRHERLSPALAAELAGTMGR